MINNKALQLIKLSLSGIESTNLPMQNEISFETIDWEEQFEIINAHAIAPLVSELNKFVPDNSDIKKVWKESMYFNVYSYSRLVNRQNIILEAFLQNKIPVVVVKGTSAAKYYPKPQLRTVGDIDLLVRPVDYEQAVCCLIGLGCKETTSRNELKMGRHRSFQYKDVLIELHHFFSFCMEVDKAKALDNMLFNTISHSSTILPVAENGLVLLSHIRQHLEGGIGLRQIIDWLMFVRACLDDEMWYSSFQEKARITGLETLAITVTRMCQIYLGLTEENITWCRDAQEEVCSELIQYVMDCGNFGRNRELFQSSGASKLPSLKHPIQLFRYIQSRGEKNWNILRKCPCFKPFAWIYQSCRYIKLALQNRVGAKKLKAIYDEGNKRNEMFAALGLKI